MSSRTMHRWVLSTQSAASYLRSTSRRLVGSNLIFNTTANSSRFSVQRLNAAVLQARHVHQARARRPISGLKMTGIVLACWFGAAGISLMSQVATGGTLPPYTWARKVDQQTREEVQEMLVEAFDMARNTAPRQLNTALREATFSVPHGLARLNKDAPDFRLEEIGPMVDAKKIWNKVGERFPSLAPFVDLEAETRVFLYFPKGATKATAIFVAINAELKFPTSTWDWSANMVSLKRFLSPALEVSLIKANWESQHRIWARNNPAVISRVEELERIPIIFNFREKAFGAMYYRRLGLILNNSMSAIPLSVRHLGRRISYH